MKKKFLIAVLSIGLMSTSLIGANVSYAKSSADFTDLKDLDVATKAKFDALIAAGIFDGVSEGTFGLKEEMNRAQFAKVAALITGIEVDQDLKKSTFTDVKVDDPASGYALPYIEAIRAAGITEGVGNGNFDPTGTVTKEQLATFLVRSLGKEEEAKPTPPVSDSTVSSWAKGYVGLALELKLLGNSPDGTFGGKEVSSRGLLATGGFEAARIIEATKPLEVSGADFVAGNKLNLTLTVSVNADSVDLSKITINGVPLDPKLDSYELSEDKKTIIIKLHEGFQLDSTKTPVITVNGLITLFGNEVKNEESKAIPVMLTEPPAILPPVTQPAPTPVTPIQNPVTDIPGETPSPNPGTETPNPNPNPNPNPGPNSPGEQYPIEDPYSPGEEPG